MECPCCLNPALLPEHLDIPKCINIPLTIIHRLEAATSRLEDMVPTISDQSASTNGVASLPESGLTAPRLMFEMDLPLRRYSWQWLPYLLPLMTLML